MKLFEIQEVKNIETGKVYCKMPRVAFLMTEKGKLFSFLSGAIVVSYTKDLELRHGIVYHLVDALIIKLFGE